MKKICVQTMVCLLMAAQPLYSKNYNTDQDNHRDKPSQVKKRARLNANKVNGSTLRIPTSHRTSGEELISKRENATDFSVNLPEQSVQSFNIATNR